MKRMIVIFLGLLVLNAKAQLLTELQLDTARLFKSLEEANQYNPDSVYRIKLKKKIPEFPAELFKYKNLNELILIKNGINKIPDSISSFKYLQILKVSQNRIDTLTPNFFELQNLKTLSFGQNEIRVIPKEVGLLKKVEYLDFSYNEIHMYPNELGNLERIKKLDLSGMLMSHEEHRRIKKLIKLIPGAKVFMSAPCKCSF